MSSRPLTKTCHECVWLSGVPGGLGFESEKGVAVLPTTKGRRICVSLTRLPSWFDGAMAVSWLSVRTKRAAVRSCARRCAGLAGGFATGDVEVLRMEEERSVTSALQASQPVGLEMHGAVPPTLANPGANQGRALEGAIQGTAQQLLVPDHGADRSHLDALYMAQRAQR